MSNTIYPGRALRVVQALFWLAVVVTLVCLLAPASAVLAAKVWLASWLPVAAAIDSIDPSADADKLVHACLFAVLGALGARSWPDSSQRWRIGWGLFFLTVFTEALQSVIPGRSASFGDLLADMLGAGAALFVSSFAPVVPSRKQWRTQP